MSPKKYNLEIGKYTRQHIYGEGITDSFKSFGKKIFRTKATKKHVDSPPPPKKPDQNSSKKAGDKIVKMLTREKPSAAPTKYKTTTVKVNNSVKPKTVTKQEINEKELQIMSAGKII